MRDVIWVLVAIAGCGGATTTAETSGGFAGGAGDVPGGAGAVGAGAAGSVVSGGSGGAPGSMGSSGSGGGFVADASVGHGGGASGGSTDGGVPPECTSDKDCKIFTDCCACEAVPNGEMPPTCDVACKQSQCSSLGLVRSPGGVHRRSMCRRVRVRLVEAALQIGASQVPGRPGRLGRRRLLAGQLCPCP